MKKLLAIIFLTFPFFAQANSNCDKPINDFDGLYCLYKVYGESDWELNAQHKEFVALLDAAGKSILKQGQTA